MPRFLHELIRLPNDDVADNGWWKIDDNRLENMFGGRHDYILNDDDIIVEAGGWEDIAFNFLVPNSRFGWVDPDGIFYGCKYTDHRMIARYIFGMDEFTLEKTHVKIYGYGSSVEAYTQRPFLTEQQVKTLKERRVPFCRTDNGIIDFDDDN